MQLIFVISLSRCQWKGAEPLLINQPLAEDILQNGSPQLTCALFSKCLTADSADNCGGQSQPDGSIDYITDSAGYCKNY
jgi:hypothetical protein